MNTVSTFAFLSSAANSTLSSFSSVVAIVRYVNVFLSNSNPFVSPVMSALANRAFADFAFPASSPSPVTFTALDDHTMSPDTPLSFTGTTTVFTYLFFISGVAVNVSPAFASKTE